MPQTKTEAEVVLLTGGTSDIGRVAAKKLAATGTTVAIVGRDADRGDRIEREVTASTPGEVRFHRVDLAKQAAVRRLAETMSETYGRLDVLVHNAGLSVAERTATEDGIELTFAVNHLAPYLLTHELVGLLRDSAPARVVVTASGIHTRGTLDLEDLQFERGYDALSAYARSKLANVAFTVELASRLSDDIVANCFHPGFLPSTRLFRDSGLRTRLFMRAATVVPRLGTDQKEGARRLVELAVAPEYERRTGCYVGKSGPEEPAATASDPAVRKRLWEESASLTGVDPDWP
ncbi:SDR family NAD(P)-dependent oxidoreductase (plasmid) [Haloferacaceae archaeon DSL9]